MKVKEESEKVGLKLNIQRTKIMTSDPITSWEIDRETVETVLDFILLGSKITADGDCSHEIKRCLLLGRKVMTNLDSIFKSRDITLSTKICLVKGIRCSRLTMGTSGTRSGGLRKCQSPCELLGGLSGFLSCRCRGLRSLWRRCRNLRIPLQC